MWHQPRLLNALADLLFLAGALALLLAGAAWVARMQAPVRELVFSGEVRHVQPLAVEEALSGGLKGNFFSVDLKALRGALEKLPWVRRVAVRRVWPGKIEVNVEEHHPLARWESGAPTGEWVNSYGEVFEAPMSKEESLAGLPRLFGPPGTAPELLRRYGELLTALAPLGRRPVEVVLSPRLSWRLRLDDGLLVELGREQPKAPLDERLRRFLAVYPSMVAKREPAPTVADLRYPNGFALRTTRGR